MEFLVADHPDWNVLLRTCPSRTSLAEIANKWTALIVVVLGQGPLRFTQLKDQVDGISPKVLAETLRRLQRDGIVTRTAYAEVPPRVEYELTERGQSLHAPLDALRVWAESNIDDVLKSRDAFDRL